MEDNKEKTTEPVVKLTMYEWHMLLGELEQALRICNRDKSRAEFLYKKIAEQLNEKEI